MHQVNKTILNDIIQDFNSNAPQEHEVCARRAQDTRCDWKLHVKFKLKFSNKTAQLPEAIDFYWNMKVTIKSRHMPYNQN